MNPMNAIGIIPERAADKVSVPIIEPVPEKSAVQDGAIGFEIPSPLFSPESRKKIDETRFRTDDEIQYCDNADREKLTPIFRKYVPYFISAIEKALVDPINKQHVCNQFCSKRPPRIDISDYVDRIAGLLITDETSFANALILLNRYNSMEKSCLRPCNVHRLILTSFVMAEISQSDFYYKTEFAAQVGGISLNELSALTRYFFYCIAGDAFIREEEYKNYNDAIFRPLNLLGEQKETSGETAVITKTSNLDVKQQKLNINSSSHK